MDNSIRLGLSQKLTQTLKMTPEMQLAIKILQLNSLELKNQIIEVLETNPVVELDETKVKENEVPLEKFAEGAGPEQIPVSKEFKEPSRDDYGVDWQKYIEDSESTEFKVSSGSYNAEEETSFENFVSKKTNLREHLTTQLHEVNLSTTQKKIGEYLIGLLDRNGYLRHSAEQIADLLKIDVPVVRQLIEIIQRMDPLGVGAFDLKECLLIQAHEEGYDDDSVTAIIQNHLEELGQNKIVNISKATGYDIEEIQAAAEVIRSFNPRPGASFPTTGDEIYVSPDVFVEKVGDEYVVAMNERDLPRLRINNLYRDAMMHKDKTEKETYEFIRGKLEAARSFLKYVDKRKETIMNVTKAICEVQKDFLDFGILHLKPLTLQDVANMAGVHESTVSRATSGKYAQTPRGLFELKFFFSGAARTQSGEDVSTMAVKKRIDDLVKQENPKKPLSDSDIVDTLKKEGIFIARRTVAKYRTELNIPSSSARRQH
ncbi:MAG: RNA polymerase factor sigma-54 [Candidatus Rifleibacteriota bacterium]